VYLFTVWKEKNVLPYAGGLLEQPNYIVEAFGIIGNEFNRVDKAEREKKGK